MGSTRTPRHRLEPVPGRRPARAPAAALVATAALLAALGGAGGSYALWEGTAEAPGATLSSGTAALVASWSAPHDAAAWSAMLPGEAVRQGFRLDNGGDADLAIDYTAAAGPDFELRLLPLACGGSPLSVDPAAEVPQPLALPAAPGVPVVIPAGGALTGCLELRLAATAAPGDEVELLVQFTGRQAP